MNTLFLVKKSSSCMPSELSVMLYISLSKNVIVVS